MKEPDNNIKILYNALSYHEYLELINSVYWKIPSERLLKISLKNGINVKCVFNNETIGMARFVTDGGYAGLIMDVVVKPAYQKKGYGKMMLSSLLDYLKGNLLPGEEMMIQLLSAPQKQAFYEKFGFKVNKKVAEDGMYMWLRNGE